MKVLLLLVLLTIFSTASGTTAVETTTSRPTASGIDYDAVRKDLLELLVSGGDYGNHGPRLIRLAWHCAGTYRTTDGRGGCDGARIRFDPELSWADNAGQDGALKLLEPIKIKYGSKISWGDLIVLAANTAIHESGGGPPIKFCAGRVDAPDGSESKKLDIGSVASEKFLIYVNPKEDGADEIREVFGHMGMNDTETVALIGGGHAFGKCHAARSGFEGPWTNDPVHFNNQYFQLLVDKADNYTWNEEMKQFEYHHEGMDLIMLLTDFALIKDDDYKEIVEKFANDAEYLSKMFKHSWEKLVNRDFGNKPCAQDEVVIPDEIKFYDQSYWNEVKAEVGKVYDEDTSMGPFLVRLAWHCAGTYRDTDHRGGCDGARIRYDPEKSWPDNAGLQDALALIEPIFTKYSTSHGLTWADLIIIAGTTALEDMGALETEFCPGRKDVQTAEEAEAGSQYLEKTIYLDGEHGHKDDDRSLIDQMKDSMGIMGFTLREMTVLNGGGHTIGQCHKQFSGFDGRWTSGNDTLDNEYFKTLLTHEWSLETVQKTNRTQFTNKDGSLMMLHTDMVFLNDPKFRAIVQSYAEDNDLFLKEFRDAWIKLVNADRYGDVCVQTPKTEVNEDHSLVYTANDGELNMFDTVLLNHIVNRPFADAEASVGEFKNDESLSAFDSLQTLLWLILCMVLIGIVFYFTGKRIENNTMNDGQYVNFVDDNNEI